MLTMTVKRPKTELTVGCLAAQAGVGVQTLHYYERLGLLPAAARSPSNHRLYSTDSLRRLRFIKKAQALGFSLEEIKTILECQQRDAVRCREVVRVCARHIERIDADLGRLTALRQSLASALPKWKRGIAACRHCAGEICDLIEGF